jgi:hypothetical protein
VDAASTSANARSEGRGANGQVYNRHGGGKGGHDLFLIEALLGRESVPANLRLSLRYRLQRCPKFDAMAPYIVAS